MFCSNCGKELADNSRFCSECGTQFGSAHRTPADESHQKQSTTGTRDQIKKSNFIYPRNPPLSPHISWVNLLLGGLAQIIYGQVAKGIVLTSATLIAGVFLPVIGSLSLSVISIVDSYKIAKKLEMGQPVGKWEWFPKS